MNPDDVVEDDYYGMITEEADHDEDQLQKKRKKRKVFKIIDEYQRVQILNYVRGNLDVLFPVGNAPSPPRS